MNTRTITVAAVMMAVAGLAQAREKNQIPAEAVTVCLGTPVAGTELAQMVTSEIFDRIGVRIDWRSMNHCPAEAIQISFQTGTDTNQSPGALAYALPYERIHIRVFYDRVRSFGNDAGGSLLGHVLAHEIGHILQGVARHSETGLMKTEFTEADRFRMCHNRPLNFTGLDADLIHSGLEERMRQNRPRVADLGIR